MFRVFRGTRLSLWGLACACVFLLGIPGKGSALDEVTYEAMLDKEKAKVGENVQYLVTVNFGTQTMVPNITPPSFNQFSVINEYQTSQTKNEDAEHVQVLKKFWLLRPNEPGKLSIAAAIITYQDPTTNLLKNGKTQVQFIQVESAENAPAGTGASAEKTKIGKTAAPLTREEIWAQPKFMAVVGGVILAVAVLLVWVLRHPRTRGPAAEDTALRGLDQAIRHAEQENLQAYYAALTRAFLDYLQNKFGIDGNVLGTEALLARMKAFGFGPDVLRELETFLKTADKAKFGGYVPHEDEMIVLHGIVKKFIEAGRRIRFQPALAKKKTPRGEDED